jgi:hypothetical protein
LKTLENFSVEMSKRYFPGKYIPLKNDISSCCWMVGQINMYIRHIFTCNVSCVHGDFLMKCIEWWELSIWNARLKYEALIFKNIYILKCIVHIISLVRVSDKYSFCIRRVNDRRGKIMKMQPRGWVFGAQ